MRVLVPALLLVAMAVSGCAGYELEGFVPPESLEDGNLTVEPVLENSSEAPLVEETVYPVVRSIAVAEVTAPVTVELDRVEGESATLLLVADAQGLRCVSLPNDDPMASPPGYRAQAGWTRCNLSADGQEFASAAADSTAADLPVMQGIPVEPFTWNMTVGRVLVNNTGEHDEVLEEAVREQDPSPQIAPRYTVRQEGMFGIYSGSDWHHVCDSLLAWDPALVQLTAVADNGRAMLRVDIAQFEVLDFSGLGPHMDVANVTGNETGAYWWQDGEMLHAVGAWAEDSVAQLNLTIRFLGTDGHNGLLPPTHCLDALYADEQILPVDARAQGVAAGWRDVADDPLHVVVWHQ